MPPGWRDHALSPAPGGDRGRLLGRNTGGERPQLRRFRSEEHTSELQSLTNLVCRLLLEKKNYSLGMQARLGFGVAAFLEPAILLVDEVLAVGDAAFQQRCLDRMRQVLSQGTTLFSVAHHHAAREANCSRTIWLSEGRIVDDGNTRDVLGAYRGSSETGGQIALEKTVPISINFFFMRTPAFSILHFPPPLAVAV